MTGSLGRCLPKFLVLLLALNWIIVTHAEARITEQECTTKNFADRFGAKRKQGKSNFCYSFSAADLYSEALGVSTTTPISALYCGTQYISMTPAEAERANTFIQYDQSSTTLLENINHRSNVMNGKSLSDRAGPLGGHTDLLLAHLLSKTKLCSEADVPSENNKDDYFMNSMEDLAGEKEAIRFLKEKQKAFKDPRKVAQACPLNVLYQEGETFDALQAKVGDYVADQLKKNVEAKCTLEPNAKNLSVHMRAFKDDRPEFSESASYMMSVLDQDRPFVLHFNACITKDMDGCKKEYKEHAVVVMGRMWSPDKKGGRCLLQMRDSASQNCEASRSSVKCDKKTGIWQADFDEITKQNNDVIWIKK